MGVGALAVVVTSAVGVGCGGWGLQLWGLVVGGGDFLLIVCPSGALLGMI